MSCTFPLPELESRSVVEKIVAWKSLPIKGAGTTPPWKSSGSSGEDQASTHVSDGDDDSASDSLSPRCCWGSTPSPRLVAVSAWAGSVTSSFAGTVQPTCSLPARNLPSVPFQALDLPDWARMTEQELDELSDSDCDCDSEGDFADGSPDGLLDDCVDEYEDEFSDHIALKTLTDDVGENSDSGNSAEAEVLCPCGSPSSSFVSDPPRWADLADSEDEDLVRGSCELAQASCVTDGPKTGRGPRLADLVDTEEEDFRQCPAAVGSKEPSLQAARWADLVDSDIDYQ